MLQPGSTVSMRVGAQSGPARLGLLSTQLISVLKLYHEQAVPGTRYYFSTYSARNLSQAQSVMLTQVQVTDWTGSDNTG